MLDLLKRGEKNGVKNLRIVEKEELFEMEPHLNSNSVAALYSPDAGTVTPYEFTIAVAENAADNGVKFAVNTEVTSIQGSKGSFEITTRSTAPARPSAKQYGVAGVSSVVFLAAAVALVNVGTLCKETLTHSTFCV